MSRAESIEAVRMVLGGRVQGVGFRYFTRREATRLGLVGWVKNLPSGEVEVQVAGPGPSLETLRRRLRQGPAGSRVDRRLLRLGVEEGQLLAARPLHTARCSEPIAPLPQLASLPQRESCKLRSLLQASRGVECSVSGSIGAQDAADASECVS